jgi:hypothetical protein
VCRLRLCAACAHAHWSSHCSFVRSFDCFRWDFRLFVCLFALGRGNGRSLRYPIHAFALFVRSFVCLLDVFSGVGAKSPKSSSSDPPAPAGNSYGPPGYSGVLATILSGPADTPVHFQAPTSRPAPTYARSHLRAFPLRFSRSVENIHTCIYKYIYTCLYQLSINRDIHTHTNMSVACV